MMPETASAPPRTLKVKFRPGWDPAGDAKGPRGLFRPDPRARTLLKVLVSYPEVRFVLPDRISLDSTTSGPLLEVIARFLDRQSWLVERVDIG